MAVFFQRSADGTPPSLKPRNAQRLLNWHQQLCRILHIQVNVHGVVPSEQALWVSNHISWLDIPVLASLSPKHFVAKSEVMSWPMIGHLAGKSGSLFVDRYQIRAMADTVKQVTHRLDQGQVFAVFPESTSSLGDKVKSFKPAFFQAAIDNELAVQPVTLIYRDGLAPINHRVAFIEDDDFLGHLWRVLGEPDIKVDVYLHATLNDDNNRQTLAKKAQTSIEQALQTP